MKAQLLALLSMASIAVLAAPIEEPISQEVDEWLPFQG